MTRENDEVMKKETGRGASRIGGPQSVRLVEIAATFDRTTQTRDLVLFDRKVIVYEKRQSRTTRKCKSRHTIGNLVPELNILLGIDYNLFLPIDRDNLRRTIGVTRVINQPPIFVHCASDTFSTKDTPNGKRTQDYPSS